MMKKIISVMLIILTLSFSLFCSCEEKEGSEILTDECVNKESETVGDAADEYDGVFKAGYAIADISPTSFPLKTEDSEKVIKVAEEIYATCVAVFDGETTALLITVDSKDLEESFDKEAKRRITQSTGVPSKNIMINTMHNHTSISSNIKTYSGNTLWTSNLYGSLVEISENAIADLSDASIYTGLAKSTNMAFVRRYIHQDGSFSSIHYRGASNTPIVSHETEADDDIQIIRFVRNDKDPNKKDIVIANWQAHVASAVGSHPNAISGDYVFYMRRSVQQRHTDVLFAYYLGAAGNINIVPKISSRAEYGGNYRIVGNAVAASISKALDSLEPANAGKISCMTSDFAAERRVLDENEELLYDKIIESGCKWGTPEFKQLTDELGLHSIYETIYIYNRGTWQWRSKKLTLGAICFGDIAFASAPFEMFDTTGMQIKQNSPRKMTFVLAYTGGQNGYVPSELATKNGGYEVYSTRFVFGTAEKVAEKLVEMIESLG